jgi:hypothetical protein
VRLNGRVWEAIHARLEHRRPLDLYHTALVVRVPEGRYVVENCWPIPDAEGAASRGVLGEGPVASRWMGRWRVFRYEVRCWRDGTIADANEAVASPQLLSDDPLQARRLLELVGCLPSPVWGRDQLGTGEMWNSNSVIAWLLAQSGLPMEAIRPRPVGGRQGGRRALSWPTAGQAQLVTPLRVHGTLRGAHPRFSRSDSWRRSEMASTTTSLSTPRRARLLAPRPTAGTWRNAARLAFGGFYLAMATYNATVTLPNAAASYTESPTTWPGQASTGCCCTWSCRPPCRSPCC